MTWKLEISVWLMLMVRLFLRTPGTLHKCLKICHAQFQLFHASGSACTIPATAIPRNQCCPGFRLGCSPESPSMWSASAEPVSPLPSRRSNVPQAQKIDRIVLAFSTHWIASNADAPPGADGAAFNPFVDADGVAASRASPSRASPSDPYSREIHAFLGIGPVFAAPPPVFYCANILWTQSDLPPQREQWSGGRRMDAARQSLQPGSEAGGGGQSEHTDGCQPPSGPLRP